MLMFDVRALLVSLTNLQHGTNYTVDEATFGTPYGIEELLPGTATKDNTSIRVKIRGVEYTHTYRRVGVLDAMRQFQQATRSMLKLKSDPTSFAAGVAKAFVTHYGFPMTADDIFEPETLIEGDTLYLTIAKRSVQWLPGKYSFKLDGKYVRDGNEILRVIEPARVEPEWWYEDRVDWFKLPDNTPRADILTYGIDYSPIREYLTLLGQPTWVAGYVQTNLGFLQDLANALRSIDGLPWSVDTGATTLASGKYNLYNLWCPYNGPVANCRQSNANLTRVPAEQLRVLEPANPAFTHVCMLRPEAGATAIGTKGIAASTILIHYNA